MKKIKIARTPTINEALKSELKRQEENEKLLQKAWEDKYGIDEPYGVTDWRDWTYDDDDDDYSDYGNGGYYDNDDYDYEEDLFGKKMETQEKEIYFYEKLDFSDDGYEDNQYDHLFTNIKELKDFCTENGINIPNNELECIQYRQASYCTFDPLDKEKGILTLLSDNSWGSLWWECHDLNEETFLDKL
jgi:hypothetical protein